jgi:proteasome lid subunit RPN8/RPN11
MLTLPRALADAIRRHAERDYPAECCGVLLGRVVVDNEGEHREVAETRACANARVKEDGHNRYAIAPQDLIAAQREARERGLAIVGFYHSHPDHPAQWSTTDFAEAHWLGCSYVITSIEHGKAATTNSFLLRGAGEDDKKFEDEAIQIDIPANLAATAAHNQKGSA